MTAASNLLRSDIVFHDIVVDISRGDIELSLPEWALYRRTMTDLYNPRGPLWALCGMTVWKRIFPRAVLSPLIAGLYSWEAAWSFHEKYPVASFFRDISVMDPKYNQLAAKLRNEVPRIDGMNFVGDKRSTLHRLSDFARLKRTRLMFFGTKTASQLHRATGVGTITCDFGPKPQKTSDIAFVLGSHTSIGNCGYPVLRGIGSRPKKGAVQPTIRDFSAFEEKQSSSSSPSSSTAQKKKPEQPQQQLDQKNGNAGTNDNIGGNNIGEQPQQQQQPPQPPKPTADETASSKWTGTIGGCAEIAVPPSLGDENNPDYPSSSSSSSGNNNNNSNLSGTVKANLAKRRQAILSRLRGATAKSATTPAERQKNCIRDVPLTTVWAYAAADDFIENSDYVVGAMWFLIQVSAAWDVGWIVGGADNPEQ